MAQGPLYYLPSRQAMIQRVLNPLQMVGPGAHRFYQMPDIL